VFYSELKFIIRQITPQKVFQKFKGEGLRGGEYFLVVIHQVALAASAITVPSVAASQ